MLKGMVNIGIRSLLLFGIACIFSCKKEVETLDLSNKGNIIDIEEYFSIPTNIDKLTDVKHYKVSDSLKKIEGTFNSYLVTGFLNNKNQKINWWKIMDKSSRDNNVKIEFILYDGKEKINQFIFYDSRGKEYLKNGKFYKYRKINDSMVEYKFYTPNQNVNKSFAAVSCYVNLAHKLKNYDCKKMSNFYTVNIPIPKNSQDIFIDGLFTEGVQYNKDEKEVFEIYFSDLIGK